jgi:hypothetical protein
MSQKNIITYFLAILVFTVNYGNAIDVQVGDGLYSTFNPSFVSAYYDEPVGFISFKSSTCNKFL